MATARIKSDGYLAQPEVGDTFYFGNYEQDDDTSNGAEPIEWHILEKDGSQMLLISEKGLDRKPYNTEHEKVTWETCTLSQWLNSEFLSTAFAGDEASKISAVRLRNAANPECGTSGGNSTEDRVFLLSLAETDKYFASSGDKICKPTAYAIANNAFISGSGACWWWLR